MVVVKDQLLHHQTPLLRRFVVPVADAATLLADLAALRELLGLSWPICTTWSSSYDDFCCADSLDLTVSELNTAK